MIFRLTNKMAKRLKVTQNPAPMDCAAKLCDWSSSYFFAHGSPYIILMHSTCYVSWVFPGKGITNTKLFLQAADENLERTIKFLGFHPVYKNTISLSFEEIQFTKVGDAVANGVMTYLAGLAKIYLVEYGRKLPDINASLNDTPIRNTNMVMPKKEFARLVELEIS